MVYIPLRGDPCLGMGRIFVELLFIFQFILLLRTLCGGIDKIILKTIHIKGK